jgi:hypothetical protein
VIVAEHYVRPQTAASMRELLAPRESRRGLSVGRRVPQGPPWTLRNPS